MKTKVYNNVTRKENHLFIKKHNLSKDMVIVAVKRGDLMKKSVVLTITDVSGSKIKVKPFKKDVLSQLGTKDLIVVVVYGKPKEKKDEK